MSIEINFNYGNLNNPPKDSNKLTYYCSMDTFTRIVQGKKIFMNDISTMNDPAEMIVHKINISNLLLQLYKKDGFEFKYYDYDFKHYVEDINMEICMTQYNTFAKIFFAVCFSKDNNNLNMWRLYGDNGKGVALTFNYKELEDFIKDKKTMTLEDIIYLDTIKDIILEISKKVFSEIKNLSLKNDEEALKCYKLNIIREINNLSFRYKTRDYKDEVETRLVDIKYCNQIICNCDIKDLDLNNYSDVNIRLRNNELIMYKEFNLEQIKPEYITLGPCNSQNITALKVFLAKNNFDVKNIYKSQIPYRS